MVKVKVNKDLCIGCGACQAIEPNVFEIDDDGLAKVIVKDVDKSVEENVIDALEGCPTNAIEKIDE